MKMNDGMETCVYELVPSLSLDDLTDNINQLSNNLKERSTNNGIRIIQSTKLQTRNGRS